MAATKKYATLPDLDVAPEIYETPSLTDSTSTAPTATIRTDSPTPSSEDENPDLERVQFNRDEARRKFEPHVLGRTSQANFSDTVDVKERQSYSTRRRRRRGKFRDDRDGEGEGSESEDEGLSARIARLKREAEEVRMELERSEADDKHVEGEEGKEDHSEVAGLEDLDRLLQGLKMPSNTASIPEFLDKDPSPKQLPTKSSETQPPPLAQPSTITSLAIIADRLTALENTLGISSIDPASYLDPTNPTPTTILPHLTLLSSQLTTLTNTLSPSNPSTTTTTTTTTSSSSPPPTLPHLDLLSTRLSHLSSSATTLLTTRQSATTALSDLSSLRARYEKTRHTRTPSIPKSLPSNPLQSLTTREGEIHSSLFLSEQASKINALYAVLPTITGLQGLLPVVLERLRGLSVVHAGAGEVKGQVDGVVNRQREMEGEVRKWREVVERVEGKMEEMRVGMKEDVRGVEGLVGGLEGRVKALKEER